MHEYVICTEMVMLSVEAFQTWGNECVQSVRREQTCTMDGVIQLNINKKVLHTSSMVLVGNRLVSFVCLAYGACIGSDRRTTVFYPSLHTKMVAT